MNKTINADKYIIEFVQNIIRKELRFDAPPPSECNIKYDMSYDSYDKDIYIYWHSPMSLYDSVLMQIQNSVVRYFSLGKEITKVEFIRKFNRIKKAYEKFEKITK